LARFDRVIIADWSASSAASPARPSADAIWLGTAAADGQTSQYFRTRATAEAVLRQAIDVAQANGERLLIGFDFPMGYPQGFAAQLTGQPQARAVWQWLDQQITDGPNNRNNRFVVADAVNRQLGGRGPFWGRPAGLNLPNLAATKAIDYAALGFAERRQVETVVPRAQPVWKLYTTGAAGSQGLMGQPMIHRFSQLAGVAVWPFERAAAPVVLAEVYPSLLAKAVAADPAAIKDEAQVRLLSRALFRLAQTDQLAALLAVPEGAAREEGWILGAGHVPAMLAA
jgi:hypothetical protein